MEGGSGFFAVEDTSTMRGSSLAEVEYSPGARQIAVGGHLSALHHTGVTFHSKLSCTIRLKMLAANKC